MLISYAYKKRKEIINMRYDKEKMKRLPLDILIFLTIFLSLSSAKISFSSYIHLPSAEKSSFFKPVIDKLIAKGADTNFIKLLMSDSNALFSEKLIKINVTGFLNKPSYKHFYNDKSVEKTKEFIALNKAILDSSAAKFGVPGEVIASVLWVETKHGTYLGNNSISGVFLSAAMANRPKYIEMNIADLKSKFEGTQQALDSLIQKIKVRADKKADWAIKELLAIQKMRGKSPIAINKIKGSWAGAFGMCQFLPSSYNSWAVDGNGDGKINLFDKYDAIFSVGNYLKSNGWGPDEQSQKKAVFHYNNSSDYVNAVLTLASLCKQ